jgi:hypothetical protein
MQQHMQELCETAPILMYMCAYLYTHIMDMNTVLVQREARERDCKKTPNSELPPLFYSTLDKVQEMLEVRPILHYYYST